MNRPEKGTPEWDLWVAAIDVAADAPYKRGTYSQRAGIYWPRIDKLRAALEAVGIDWRSVKAADEGEA